ncbi:hypothetical protein JCM8547_005446 [Rhodosporidiobolus lusitaniae]
MIEFVELESTPGSVAYSAKRTPPPLSLPALFFVLSLVGLLLRSQPAILGTMVLASLAVAHWRFQSVEETFNLHPNLGLQLTNTRKLVYTFSLPFLPSSPARARSTILTYSTFSVSFSAVKGVVINEGLQGCEGHFLLAVLCTSQGKMRTEVAFPVRLSPSFRPSFLQAENFVMYSQLFLP